MSKNIRVSEAKIKTTKGHSNWACLHNQTDEQIHSNSAGRRSSRELSDVELQQLRKPKKI